MNPAPVSPRQCGDCAMCCYLGEIPAVKPFNQWCVHCPTHDGCAIYDTRPTPCRDFFCHYLLSDLGEEWYPATCGFIVSTYANPSRAIVSVDPNQPDSWKQPQYLPQIMHWAQQGAVTVQVGLRVFAVYPERIDDLGMLGPHDAVTIIEQETTRGLRWQVQITPGALSGQP